MAFLPDTAFEFLRRAHQGGRLAHAYLITGVAGSGKRDLALRLAGYVNGLGEGCDPRQALKLPDVHLVEPESKSRIIKVEQMRELERALQMRSMGGLKVGIIQDADRLNAAAANSFLKTLEEPPAHSLLLLVTAHPEMLLDTIISRCIQVQLKAPAHRELTPGQARLLEAVKAHFRAEKPALVDVFNLVREFTQLLNEVKNTVQEEEDGELKKEEALYKQTTDGKWLEEREEHYKALIEARYLQLRLGFVDTLLQWWGDVLRHQHGSTHLDFPGHAADTAALAQRFSTADVLRRVEALEGLRENFGRNVQEQLAIEVAFMTAFG